MACMKKKERELEALKRACEVCKCSISLPCKELTLLVNACAEAAQFRRDHSMPHAEKYDAMEKKLHALSDSLDTRIADYARDYAERTSS